MVLHNCKTVPVLRLPSKRIGSPQNSEQGLLRVQVRARSIQSAYRAHIFSQFAIMHYLPASIREWAPWILLRAGGGGVARQYCQLASEENDIDGTLTVTALFGTRAARNYSARCLATGWRRDV
eukprot:6182833-Pleurochrysis_carterae.AAC.5